MTFDGNPLTPRPPLPNGRGGEPIRGGESFSPSPSEIEGEGVRGEGVRGEGVSTRVVGEVVEASTTRPLD